MEIVRFTRIFLRKKSGPSLRTIYSGESMEEHQQLDQDPVVSILGFWIVSQQDRDQSSRFDSRSSRALKT